MSAPTTATTTLKSVLNFYKPGGEGTEELHVGFSKNKDLKFNVQEAEIDDARGREEEFTLDKHGFEFTTAPTSFADYEDEEAIRSAYFNEVEKFMCKHLDATEAHCVNHVVRWGKEDHDLSDNKAEKPASFVHCDWSYRGAWKRIDGSEDYKPPNWDTLKQNRWAAFSVWRPLNTVTRDALAVGDKRTVPDTDLRPYKLSYPGGLVSEGNSLAFDPRHRFYYWSGMVPGEVILIKLFDSKLDGRARCTPHTAFKSVNDFGEPRKSIETRVIVFWSDQDLE